MTTPWYYNYYDKGKFPHQQTLCEEVAWIRGLEGQKRKSQDVLSAPIANPLTLRLRTISKAYIRLKRETINVNNAINKAATSQFSQNQSFGCGGTFHAQSSNLKTEGAPIYEIEIETGTGNKLYIYHKIIHYALYDFFINLSSVLGRLFFEINMLYTLGNWERECLDWNRLVNPKKPNILQALTQKDDKLGKFIENMSGNFNKVSAYRNRLIHDAIVHTNIEETMSHFPRVFQVLLPDDPKNPNSPNTIDAIDYCRKLKSDVLKLLDGSYKVIIENIKTSGNPPW